MNKIIILGDSLAATRPDKIPLESRWPQLINSDNKIYNLASGSSTSKKLYTVRFSEYKKTDLAIIQLGIVDCVPRLITRRENFIIGRLPSMLRAKIIYLLKTKRKRSKKRSYVSLEEYVSNFDYFINKFPGKILIVKILNQGTKFKKLNPEAGKCITDYNTSLTNLCIEKNNVKLIDVPTQAIDELTLDDGYHLNAKGHKYLAQIINDKLSQLWN